MKNFPLSILIILLMYSCEKKTEAALKAQQNTISKKEIVSSKENNAKNSFDILKYLLDEEVKNGGEYDQLNYKDYTVHFPNKGDSYSVKFSKIANEDLNNDGVVDYIVDRNSEGMLGGNTNTTASILYIIVDKNNNIKQKHEILEYAPFSYNLVSDFEFKNKKLKAIVAQNYKSYNLPVDSLKSTDLSFIYKDGNLFEESYFSLCKLGKWKNKKILNNRTSFENTIDMHNYTEVLKENFKDKSKGISIELSGCDNLDLTIEGDFLTTEFSKKMIAEKKLEFFSFLIANSNLKAEFETIKNYFSQDNEHEKVVKSGNLSFNLFINEIKDKKIINFRLNLSIINNISQEENWQITTRQKNK